MGKKIIIAAVVVVAIAAFMVANLRSDRGVKEVETAKVSRQDVVAVVEASGRLRPAVSVDLSSDVIGRVVAVGAREGDTVEKGRLLVQVESTQYDLRVTRARSSRDQAKSRLRETRANLAQLQAQLRRDEGLYREQMLPDSLYDQSRTAVDMAESQVESAELQLDQSRTALAESEDQLSKTRILAPMDGVVVRKQVEVGEVAIQGTLNNPGSLLMTIADLSTMETEVEVDETDVVNIEPGQLAEVELDAFPDRVFAGRVTEVARSAEAASNSQSADFKVVVTLDEIDRAMRPGLSATASITTQTKEDVLAIPIQALLVRDRPKDGPKDSDKDEPDDAAAAAAVSEDEAEAEAEAEDKDEDEDEDEEVEGVFVVIDGEAQFRAVEVGIAGEKEFELIDGLAEDEVIVTGNFQVLRSLKHGDKVKMASDKDKKKDRGRKERDSGD